MVKKYGYRILDPPSATTAHKGYLIKKTMHGFAISKDGHHIAWASSLEDAKKQIDGLT